MLECINIKGLFMGTYTCTRIQKDGDFTEAHSR